MYTEQEKKFMAFWEQNREKRKKIHFQLMIGLPAGVLLVFAIFISMISGWHKKALMEFNSNKSVILILVIAAVLIVGFIALFTARHKWDLNEQHYRELLSKKQKAK